jgi:ubiquinone/menaquinone biosynthesis C-methylase UbiE
MKARVSVVAPGVAEPTAWEKAYLRFETPEQEVRKFIRRLVAAGAQNWSKDSTIVELFCGRGNGLRALHALGFARIRGIDLSFQLARRHDGPGQVLVGDCRELPFGDETHDVLIVQGGLHHLISLPEDLDTTLAEVARVLRRDGRFIAVEPWQTPFLRVVHAACNLGIARRLSKKIDALATMIENEERTYRAWLDHPHVVMRSLTRFFDVEAKAFSWGKLMFVGSKRASAAPAKRP